MAAVNGSRMSLYDSLRQTNSAASLIESLQSELKQREGEVLQLQVGRLLTGDSYKFHSFVYEVENSYITTKTLIPYFDVSISSEEAGT